MYILKKWEASLTVKKEVIRILEIICKEAKIECNGGIGFVLAF